MVVMKLWRCGCGGVVVAVWLWRCGCGDGGVVVKIGCVVG